MNYRDWEVINTLAQEKNITKTAEKLFISQPSLTYRLKQLEKELGVTIIYRNRRGIEFTEQGEYLVDYAQEMLKKYRDLKENLWNLDDKIKGTLNLGVARAVAIYKLPSLLSQFRENFPHVNFKVHTGLNLNLIQSVYKQEFHLGIVRGNHHWSEGKHIITEENICVISSTPFEIEELPHLPRIDYQTDSALTMMIDNWWKENYVLTPKVIMRVDNMEIAKRMAAHGLGYTIVPDIVLEDNDNFYIYNLKNLENEYLKWTTWILYRSNYYNLATVREFISFIRNHY